MKKQKANKINSQNRTPSHHHCWAVTHIRTVGNEPTQNCILPISNRWGMR